MNRRSAPGRRGRCCAYEAAGLIAPARRSSAGYRLFAADAVSIVTFIVKARRAGFSVAEIREIVGIRRSGRKPCTHVRTLIDTKLANIERSLAALQAARDELIRMRKSWRTVATKGAAICPRIERLKASVGGR